MWKMTVYQWLILFVLLLKDAFSLNVVLTIEPQIVRRMHDATLICSYDLQGATLYYAKWYRGNYEFYRYTPTEEPSSKVFDTAGINVDVSRSNSTQVVLTDIDFQLSGNFSCEITTAEEPVSTGMATNTMLVVQLPEYPPKISVGREPLDYGDTLRANCTSPPSRPPALLQFFLNNMRVNQTRPLSPRQSSELLWSDLPLELVLNKFHFSEGGKLILRCESQVAGIYHEVAVLELDSARDPVPEKVSALNSAITVTNHTLLLYFLFTIFTIVQT